MSKNKDTLPQYESFAQLFEELEQYELAAYFYQVSKREVDARIYDKVFASTETKFLGIIIKRKRTVVQKAAIVVGNGIKISGKGILTILNFLGLIIFSPFISLAFLFGLLINGRQTPPRRQQRMPRNVNNGQRGQLSIIVANTVLIILLFIIAGGLIILGIYQNLSPEERQENRNQFTSILKAIGNSLSAFKFWIPKNIQRKTLEASIPKFPTTINSFQETKVKLINKEGYKMKPEVIYSIMLDEICLVIVREKVEENQGKNCLDFSIVGKNEREIEKLPKEEKEKWAKTIYSYEYENRIAGFKVDGVIDETEQEIIQQRIVKTLDNSFKDSTRRAIYELVLEIQSENEDLDLNYIEIALKKILNASSYTETIQKEWPKGTDEKYKRGLQGKWIEGIYDFQVAHKLDPSTITYGVIEKDDPTYEKLKEVATKELTVPENVMTNALQKFATTKKGIDHVRNEVYNNLMKDQTLRYRLIKKHPGLIKDFNGRFNNLSLINDIDYRIELLLRRSLFFRVSADPTDKFDEGNRKKWVEAIYLYQKYQLVFNKRDGIMSPYGETSKRLIEEITKRMKKII